MNYFYIVVALLFFERSDHVTNGNTVQIGYSTFTFIITYDMQYSHIGESVLDILNV